MFPNGLKRNLQLCKNMVSGWKVQGPDNSSETVWSAIRELKNRLKNHMMLYLNWRLFSPNDVEETESGFSTKYTCLLHCVLVRLSWNVAQISSWFLLTQNVWPIRVLSFNLHSHLFQCQYHHVYKLLRVALSIFKIKVWCFKKYT